MTEQDNAAQPRLLTVREAAEQLGLARQTVYQMISAGRISYVKLGPSDKSPVRIRQADLESYIAERVRPVAT